MSENILSLCTDFSTKNECFWIELKLVTELGNDVIVRFAKQFGSKILSVEIVSCLILLQNSNWTMGYSLGTHLTPTKLFSDCSCITHQTFMTD